MKAVINLHRCPAIISLIASLGNKSGIKCFSSCVLINTPSLSTRQIFLCPRPYSWRTGTLSFMWRLQIVHELTCINRNRRMLRQTLRSFESLMTMTYHCRAAGETVLRDHLNERDSPNHQSIRQAARRLSI